MIRIRGRRDIAGDTPVVSMSDIAFLLLVFFISTTVFDLERVIPMVLPAQSSQPIAIERREVILIEGERGGRVLVEGVPAEIREIEGIVRARLAERPETVVSIRTEPEAVYGLLIDIVDEVRKARATKISLERVGATG